MTTSQHQTAVSSEHEREDTHERCPLPHLSACLTVGALVILVILAIHLLT
jgi:hypothetical protein